MKIKIKNLREVPSDTAEKYLLQIAEWHFNAWGSIRGESLADLNRNIWLLSEDTIPKGNPNTNN